MQTGKRRVPGSSQRGTLLVREGWARKPTGASPQSRGPCAALLQKYLDNYDLSIRVIYVLGTLGFSMGTAVMAVFPNVYVAMVTISTMGIVSMSISYCPYALLGHYHDIKEVCPLGLRRWGGDGDKAAWELASRTAQVQPLACCRFHRRQLFPPGKIICPASQPLQQSCPPRSENSDHWVECQFRRVMLPVGMLGNYSS